MKPRLKPRQSSQVDLFAETPAPSPTLETPLISTQSGGNTWLGRCKVDDLVARLDQWMNRQIGIVQVEGEISGFTVASSGHWYFTLKGETSLIKCVMFRPQTQSVKIFPSQGLQVEITAVVGLYRPRGELQLQVKNLKPAGLGALYAAFTALRDKLIAEGLFESSRKKSLPIYPRRIGVITSLATAALQDVLKILRLHSPHLDIVIYPATVQGLSASNDLQKALKAAINHRYADVLLIVRGGGSMEDLFCFNDEAFIRAVADCPIPTISGVGHETDTTLIDYVVDVRAPTPTAAAHLLPAKESLIKVLTSLNLALQESFSHQMLTHQQRLDWARRLMHSMREKLGGKHLVNITQRIQRAWDIHFQQTQSHLLRNTQALSPLMLQRLEREKNRLQQLSHLLKAYDPALPQKKGYALIQSHTNLGKRVITSASDVHINDNIHIAFADGAIYANVLSVQRE